MDTCLSLSSALRLTFVATYMLRFHPDIHSLPSLNFRLMKHKPLSGMNRWLRSLQMTENDLILSEVTIGNGSV